MNANIADSSLGWRPATTVDFDTINTISDAIHLRLPERFEVFVEKFNLFPTGCLILLQKGEVVGYGFSHPWVLNSIPPLDSFLGALPTSPECLFIHDVAILPQARRHSAAGAFIKHIAAIARVQGICSLALVSVYDTKALWSRYGFEVVIDPALKDKLESYGESAQYMVSDIRSP
jgi:hypothetical protein